MKKTRTRFTWLETTNWTRSEHIQRTPPVIPPVGCTITVSLPLPDHDCNGRDKLTPVTATVTETSVDYTLNQIVVHLENVSERGRT
jgi:hypothetical protein